MAIVTSESTESPTRAAKFLSESKRNLINGKWVEALSGETFSVYDPSTGETIARVPDSGAEDIDQAVKAARRAFESGPWSKLSPSERGRVIWKIGDLLLENLEEFAELESIDNGKPVAVARVADVPLAADIFHYMAGWATKVEGNTIPISALPGGGAKFFAYTQREPVGVVGQIIPWNFPLLMAAWKLAPALATGNVVVLKPAEQTPLSALRLGELLLEAGLPDGVVNIVTGFGETAGAALAAHDDVDKIAFTGSTEVGKIIVKVPTVGRSYCEKCWNFHQIQGCKNCGNYGLGFQVLMRFHHSMLLDNFTGSRFPSSVIRHQNPYYEKSLLKGVVTSGMLPFFKSFAPIFSMFMYWWNPCKCHYTIYLDFPNNSKCAKFYLSTI